MGSEISKGERGEGYSGFFSPPLDGFIYFCKNIAISTKESPLRRYCYVMDASFLSHNYQVYLPSILPFLFNSIYPKSNFLPC